MTGRKSGSHVPERTSRKAEPTASAVNTASAPRSDRFDRSRWRQATAASPSTTIKEAPPTNVATRAPPMSCHCHTQFALDRCGLRSAAENATRAKTAMAETASLSGQRSSVLTTTYSPAPAVPPASLRAAPWCSSRCATGEAVRSGFAVRRGAGAERRALCARAANTPTVVLSSGAGPTETSWCRSSCLRCTRCLLAVRARSDAAIRRRPVQGAGRGGMRQPLSRRLVREHAGCLELDRKPAAAPVRSVQSEDRRVRHVELGRSYVARVPPCQRRHHGCCAPGRSNPCLASRWCRRTPDPPLRPNEPMMPCRPDVPIFGGVVADSPSENDDGRS